MTGQEDLLFTALDDSGGVEVVCFFEFLAGLGSFVGREVLLDFSIPSRGTHDVCKLRRGAWISRYNRHAGLCI